MQGLPSLPYHEWRETRDTLHLWTQIVGKIRLALTPRINHWWNVPLYVSAHGLTTSAITIADRCFEIEFDFLQDVLRVRADDGRERVVELAPRTVADFYAATMAAVNDVGIACRIWTLPCELTNPIPFTHDTVHRSYDRDYVLRFWHCLSRIEAVLTRFRAGFIGKCSPIHLFWGSFDLALTRFSGRRAPDFDGNVIDREAYSHEVASVGWWPGDPRHERASFYSYAVPEPPGFPLAPILPAQAYYHPTLKGFYLDHEAVRGAADPAAMLLEFCETTYAAAADFGAWPRAELERARPQPPPAEEHHADVFSSQDTRQHPGTNEGLRGVPAAGR